MKSLSATRRDSDLTISSNQQLAEPIRRDLEDGDIVESSTSTQIEIQPPILSTLSPGKPTEFFASCLSFTPGRLGSTIKTL